MKIGIYDHNCPSALTPVVLFAEEDGVPFIPIDYINSFDNTDWGLDVLIVNPLCWDGNSKMWQKCAEVVSKNPQLRFIFCVTAYGHDYLLKAGVEQSDRVEFSLLGRGNAERMHQLLKEAKSQKSEEIDT